VIDAADDDCYTSIKKCNSTLPTHERQRRETFLSKTPTPLWGESAVKVGGPTPVEISYFFRVRHIETE